MTRRALGGFAAAVLVTLVGVGFFPRPAMAAAPNISLSPAHASELGEPVSIAGHATMNNNGWVDSVKLTIASNQPHPVPAPHTTPGSEDPTLPFTWKPPLAYNGTYTVTAEAVGRDGPFPRFDNPEVSSVTHTFHLSVPPTTPGGVKAVVNQAKRTVTISWAKNPEPDVVGYSVWRKDGADFRYLTVVTATSYTDALESLPAGTYQYRVFAARPNAAGDQPVVSDPAAVSAKVTSSPPTATTSTGGTGGAVGATTTTAPGAKSPTLATRGRTDLSGFAALLPSGGAKLPAATNTPAPDSGFEDDLPFDPNAPVEDQPAMGRSDQALAEETLASSNDDEPSSLRFMAAGLLVTVVLMHLLWLRGEVNRDALPAIAPDEPLEA